MNDGFFFQIGRRIFTPTLFLLTAWAPGALAGPSGYARTQVIPLGGQGGWDYLTMDSGARRLFISRETHVLVFDLDTHTIIGDLPDTQGVHGIALAPELGRGFTSNGRAATVSVFDLTTLKAIATVKTDDGPDAIVYDPASRRVLTMNGRGRSATVIDGASGEVKGTLPLAGKPEFAVADGRGKVFANLEDQSALLEIDPVGLSILHRWSLAPCSEPSGLAIDREHRRLFAGCHNRMMAVVDADSGQVIATVPIGEGVDANAFDPGTQLALSSNGDGTLTVVHEDSPRSFVVLENVPTQRGARTMALDEKTHDVYLVTAMFGPRPAPSDQNPHPRPPILPDSFVLLVVGRSAAPAHEGAGK